MKDDDFDVEAELQKPTFSKAGDLWLLGDHRLVCSDSTKPETYELLMAGKQANLVVTDPPYNVATKAPLAKSKMTTWATMPFISFCLMPIRKWLMQWLTMPAFMFSMRTPRA